MGQTGTKPQRGDANTDIPTTLHSFADIRSDALNRWNRQRVDNTGEPWECRWQTASHLLAHDCSTPSCASTHVSLYCSFNGAAEQMVDVLQDERLDHIELGIAADSSVRPQPDSLDSDTSALFRFYMRALWAAEVVLDDLQRLLVLADGANQTTSHVNRAVLSNGAPLDANTLRAFINHVGKHGAKGPLTLHCWNHHSHFFFEDARASAKRLDGQVALTAHKAPSAAAEYTAVLMPKLGDVVDTLTTALHEADSRVNTEDVLRRLARKYGTCW